MGYESAPATKMLATRCAVCSRPLVDAKSVELGIGPDCRRKYGFDIEVDDNLRQVANCIVYQIALKQDSPDVGKLCDDLSVIGFERLAARILERVAAVRIEADTDGRLVVHTAYNPQVVDSLRMISGRRWDNERKVNTFPPESRSALWGVLKMFFSGRLGFGPKGSFIVA